MIVFRYLAKEIIMTLVALTVVLLFIFMSNQGIQYLHRAASGHLPGIFIAQLMLLELPNLIGLLLPLGFYMAIILTYGRLYADSEMIALSVGGYSPLRLWWHTTLIASGVAGLVAAIMFWGSPWVAMERAHLLKTTGIQTLLQVMVPGRFHVLERQGVVFYAESLHQQPQRMHHVFVARLAPLADTTQWDVLWAKKAYGSQEAATGEDYLVFSEGRAYRGVPGQADFKIANFGTYQVRLPHPVDKSSEDIRTMPTQKLWSLNATDLKKAAELQWRFSIPVMVFILTWIAIPLSYVNPRAGKYANVLPAVLIFIVYANFLFVSRQWIANGRLPIWLGMSGLHGLMLLLAGGLYWRQRRTFG